MKKTFATFTLLAALVFLGNTAFAQGTVFSMTVNNNSGCAIQVQGNGMTSFCSVACNSGMITVPANSSVTIPFPCGAIDATNSVVIGVFDPGSGQNVRVGNSCGVPLFDVYRDCQGINRTAFYTFPSTVTIN